MIARFLASWALFSQAYMTAWLIALLLSLIGVLVVARDQIFLGAAISQAATLGIAVALVLSDLLPGEGVFDGLFERHRLSLGEGCSPP